MDNPHELNFILHVYSGNAKVARVPCNFLMPGAIAKIIENFQSDDNANWFYTSFEIEYKGAIIHRKLIPLDDEDRQIGL
jgi:hypothetical protein